MPSLVPVLEDRPIAAAASPRLTLFDRFEQALMRLFTGIWHGCTWTGSLPPSGPVVLIANHTSHADPGFLIAACRRRLHFLHARECYSVPVLRWIFALAGCIPVTRGKPDKEAGSAALQILADGGVVV